MIQAPFANAFRLPLAVGDAAGELVGEVERDPEARTGARGAPSRAGGAGGRRLRCWRPSNVGLYPWPRVGTSPRRVELASAADVAHLDLGQVHRRLRAQLRVAVGALAPDRAERLLQFLVGGAGADRARGGRGRGGRRGRCRAGPRPRSARACSRRRRAASPTRSRRSRRSRRRSASAAPPRRGSSPRPARAAAPPRSARSAPPPGRRRRAASRSCAPTSMYSMKRSVWPRSRK